MKCSCKHTMQDELYGHGNRIANLMRSGQYKCTVCSTILGSSQAAAVQYAKPAAKEPVKEQPAKKTEDKGKKDKKAGKGSMKGGKR